MLKISILKNLASKIGIDRAIFFSSSTSIINAFGSAFSVFLVVKFMTNVEQGYYYTFGSIIAVQIFFELGLNSIITQFVAHENANLNLGVDIEFSKSQYNLSRIASLLRFSIKWYLFFSFTLLFILLFVGFTFFTKYNSSENVNWGTPWILLALGTSLNLFISPILAFLQGLGKVKEVLGGQLVGQIIRLIFIWCGLYFGFGLYVIGIGSIVYFLVIFFIISKKYFFLLYKFFQIEVIHKIDYRSEIFPFQWKIALSWISGYFIFQLFNPVLFATEGPKAAGQMGLTLTGLNGVLTLSLAWMNTKVPLFSSLIATKNYKELDKKFKLALYQSLLVNVFLLLIFLSIICSFHYFNVKIGGGLLNDRFLAPIPLFFMIIPIIINHLVASWAIYLRCHNKEPYLLSSIIGGILCTSSTLILGKYYGVMGITFGYMFINIIMAPWAYNIYKNKRKEWHY